ncbi:MAG: Bax inhibitor-1/YccA family protein [Erysipelotrichaceae bacterium]|nr:Bax inhibitor-1/YccA family protein [Erysipelotrichaceae bacterium]
MPNYDNEFSNRYDSLTFRDFLNRTYVVVALGLLISAGFAFIGSFLFPRIPAGFTLMAVVASAVLEIGIAIFFSTRLTRMENKTAWICYFLYSAFTGVSLSFILMAYTAASVMVAFVSTSVLFACMAIIGYTTKIDTSRFGGMLLGALIAMIITTLLNVFIFRSGMISTVMCYAGILIFLGLIAYDTQKLRHLYNAGLSNSMISENLMIYGAFELYLDFINLFLRLVQIFGKRRD